MSISLSIQGGSYNQWYLTVFSWSFKVFVSIKIKSQLLNSLVHTLYLLKSQARNLLVHVPLDELANKRDIIKFNFEWWDVKRILLCSNITQLGIIKREDLPVEVEHLSKSFEPECLCSWNLEHSFVVNEIHIFREWERMSNEGIMLCIGINFLTFI